MSSSPSLNPAATPVGSPVPRSIRQSASLVVLRDGAEGLEVLLLRRADKPNDQNSGASVFPGGLLDAHDRRLHAHCAGLDDAGASLRLAVPTGGLDFYAAAVRECFEEAGLLLACDARDQLVPLTGLPHETLKAMRSAAAAGTDALLSLCDAQGWRLAMDRLEYFAHWITPPGMPRRFDTRFFLAAMPPDQEVLVDAVEIVEHAWLTPSEAVSPERGLKLMNVTRRILEHLDGFATVAECVAHARAQTRVALNMPRLAGGPGGKRPVNIEEPAWAEIGFLDPDGRGDARHTLEGGLVMALAPRVWRVTSVATEPHSGEDGALPAGHHSYAVGDAEQGWTLIDPLPGDADQMARLRDVASNQVVRVWSTRGPWRDAELALLRQAWPGAELAQPSAGDVIALAGGAQFEVLSGAGARDDARAYMLRPEGLVFVGEGLLAAPDALPPDAAWVAGAQGFLQAARPVAH
ncbi:NUDIX domain-containing protein [Variovorax dokdonensis]|uniref:NUDIX domain-containing protein n=1 Tax=Variovorax dokdonensis TaxID=344883 RepID=A0ABT7N774_9BURK|nr:NUDIX domain-containing protein [Variovorax dokdonensis]MDM0043789.1 NUDIX domain-containing protein [Variovorax dokdonensis]